MATGAVIARIVSEYGDKGSKAAAKDILKLGKKFDAFGKKAAKSFALAGAAAIAFSGKILKDAIQGAMEDEKAQTGLALALRNTTDATEDAIAANVKFLDTLELQVAIDNDKLIPALQQLAQATGNLTDAQNLLKLATDVSVASGKDLSVVSSAITKAVNGQVGALNKLGLPLDQNAIKAKDLGKLLKQLAEISAGQAAAAANTFEGKLLQLQLKFKQVSEDLGKIFIPVLLQFADHIISKVLPALELLIYANQSRLRSALQQGAEQIKEFAKAFGNIYNVIKNINDILPLGISGWIQLGIALSLATKLGMLYNTAFTLVAIVSKAGATALIAAAAAAKANAGAQGANAVGSVMLAEKFALLSLTIRSYITETYAAALGQNTLNGSMVAGTGAATGLNAALLKVKATFIVMFGFVKKFAKQIAIFVAVVGAVTTLFDKIFGSDKITLDETARKASASILLADMATQSMDDAVNKYRESQIAQIEKTKEQIEFEELLAKMRAKNAAAEKKQAAIDKVRRKIDKALEKKFGVRFTDKDEYENIQKRAVQLNMERMGRIKELEELRMKDIVLNLVTLVQDEYNASQLRSIDIAKKFTDQNAITVDGIKELASKWGVAAEVAEKYVDIHYILEDNKLSVAEIAAFQAKWSQLVPDAEKYLRALLAMNKAKFSETDINQFAKDMGTTAYEAAKYLTTVLALKDNKISTKEAETLKDLFLMTDALLLLYLKTIQTGFKVEGGLLDPTAVIALNAHYDELIKKLRLVATLIATTPSVAAGTDGNSQAAVEAAVAASVAANNALADAEKEAAEAAAAAAEAAAEIAKEIAKSSNALNEIVKNSPELKRGLDILEGQIAAKAASGRSYTTDAEMDRILASVGGIGSGTSAADSERFRFSAFNYDQYKPSLATGKDMRGAQNSMAGPTINVTVQGSVTSEQDLVETIRTGLLGAQYNGSQINLQAI
jgi:hypothetical protein